MKTKKSKGFTLIEVLVTSLILVIAISAMLMSFVTTQKIIINNNHRHNASLALNQIFEAIQRRAFHDDVVNFVKTSPIIFQYEIGDNNLKDYIITFGIDETVHTFGGGALLRIKAEVEVDKKKILNSEMLTSIQE